MPDEVHEHPEVRFEPTDASFRPIAMILIGAIVILAIIHAAVFGFFRGYEEYVTATNQSAFPLAPGPSTALPRQPRLEQLDRLEGNESTNVFQREAKKLRVLNSYGPAETAGRVHVPIDDAMDFMLQKDLFKARPEPPAKEQRRAGGLVDAGESNSGRLFKKGGK